MQDFVQPCTIELIQLEHCYDSCFSGFHFSHCHLLLLVVVDLVVLLDLFQGIGAVGYRGILQRPKSRAMPQGLDQRLKMQEVVPKLASQRGSDVGRSRRR